mgnify:CR=1 FL=1
MLKRLRSAHPMLYCLVAEVLFLGMLFVASLLSLLLILFVVRDIDAVDDYMLTFMQEAAGVLVAWLFLARTGKSVLLRRRGSGFFNGLLVGLYPIALISYNAYNTLLFGRPEGDMLPAWHVVWFLIGMTSVGVAEEFLFRGVIAQTLLEHFGTSRAGVWKACLLSGLYFGAAHLTNLTGSAPLGVLMQCVFAASLGTLLAAVYFRTGNHIDELHGYGCCSDIYSHHDRAGTVSFRSIRFPVGYRADYFHFLLGFFLCYHRHISDRITGTGQTVSLTQLLRSEDSFIRRGNRCLSLRHPDPAFPTGSSPGTDRGHINPLLPENFQHGLFVSAY